MQNGILYQQDSPRQEEVLEIDLKGLFNKLSKHRRTIINAVFVCVTVALLYSFISCPVYKAAARLLVEGAPPKITKIDNVILQPDYTDRSNYYNSQIEILKSRSIARMVFQEIGGYEPWQRRGKRPERLKQINEEVRIDALLKHIKVSPVRMTNVIEISVEDPDPELSAHIANAWVNAFIIFSSADQLLQRKSELETDIDQQTKYLKGKHPIIQGLRQEIADIDAKIEQERQRVSFLGAGRIRSTASVKVLDEAYPPRFPARPKKALNLVLGLILGLFSGAGLAFIFESLDQSIKTSVDIENILKTACLATVPYHDAGKDKDRDSLELPETITHTHRHSATAEAFRALRTNISFSNPDLRKKVFLITSAGPAEGKTTVAVNLAIAFAQADEKVILVDTDLRKPKLHEIFDVKRQDGLTELLAYDKEDIGSFIHHTKIPNIDLLACGSVPPNPSELLSSHKIEALIKKLSDSYSRIIFDTPPIFAATDALILSTKVDAAILVVRAGSTHKQAAGRCIKSILGVHSKVLGVVLDMAMSQEHSPYYYYYRYGKHGKKNATRRS
jgi:capsular exopolysaccharide synthesis family protein